MISTQIAKTLLRLIVEDKMPDNIDMEKLVKSMAWSLLHSIDGLEAYCDCSDGCTCGEGWGHDPARSALEYIQKTFKV